MNYTGSMILFIFLVQLAAYTLKWLIGFGNPLISAPLLAMRLDNTLITPGSLLPDLVINGRITWQSRNNFRWRAILPLLLAMVAGVVPGTWLLRFSLPWIIKTVLGGVVVFLGLEMATRRLRPIRPDRPGDPVAAVSGGLLLRYVRGAVRHQYVSGSLPSAHRQGLR